MSKQCYYRYIFNENGHRDFYIKITVNTYMDSNYSGLLFRQMVTLIFFLFSTVLRYLAFCHSIWKIFQRNE